MRRAPPAEPLAYLLMAVVATLGAVVARALWRGTDAAALLETPARAVTPERLVFVTPDAAGLADIRNRALFYASRRFFVARAQPTTVQVPPPAYLLEGTLLIPGKPPVAFLKHQPDGASRTVHPGNELEGWKVDAIEPSGVILADSAHRIEITTKGLTSVVPPRPVQFSTIPARAPEHTVMMGAREIQKPRPIWTSNTDAIQKPAVRIYRPPK